MNVRDLFAQLPTLPSGAIETWLLCALALLPAAALAKKLFSRKCGGHEPAPCVKQAEFQDYSQQLRLELERLRDRMDARLAGIGEKIDRLRTELLEAEERRASAIHHRLNEVESSLARVDERTRG